MDARTIELNRIGDLLKNAFDGRYRNEPLSNHQKPVSVVPNRDFALKQFEFAKVAKMPISQTLVQKPADLESYWSESTIDLIRRLVKEREQYKQNSELANKQLVSESSDSAKDAEIVTLRQEIANLTRQNENYKKIVENDGIKIVKTKLENANLSTELKKCNDNVGKCNEDLGKCNKNLDAMKIQIHDCNMEKQQANEEADAAAELTQQKIDKNNSLTQQLQNAENKFKLEKAQMDIMFGMKMDLMQKQFENISNLSNADLLKQIVDLTTANEDAKQAYKQSIEDFNETMRINKENNAKLIEENEKLIEANQSNKPIIAQESPDKAKLEQLQTRVINLTQELLIMKMNADLQRQINNNYKYVPQTYEEAKESDMFDVLIEQGKLDLTGGAPKQRLSMKGGARRLYDDATQVVFKKETADKLRDQMTEYQNRFKLLKAEIDAFKSLSTSTNDDQLKQLVLKLALLKTEFKTQNQKMVSAQTANAANQGIALKLQASLKNPASPASSASLTTEINDLKTEKAQLEKENADIQTAKDALETENNNLKTKNTTLETENVGLKSDKATLEAEKTNLTNANATLEAEKTNLTNAKATLEADKANLTNANTKLEAEKTTLTNENASLKTTNANLTNQLNSTSTASGMSTAISKASATLPRNSKVFISDNGRVMFSEHK